MNIKNQYDKEFIEALAQEQHNFYCNSIHWFLQKCDIDENGNYFLSQENVNNLKLYSNVSYTNINRTDKEARRMEAISIFHLFMRYYVDMMSGFVLLVLIEFAILMILEFLF